MTSVAKVVFLCLPFLLLLRLLTHESHEWQLFRSVRGPPRPTSYRFLSQWSSSCRWHTTLCRNFPIHDPALSTVLELTRRPAIFFLCLSSPKILSAEYPIKSMMLRSINSVYSVRDVSFSFTITSRFLQNKRTSVRENYYTIEHNPTLFLFWRVSKRIYLLQCGVLTHRRMSLIPKRSPLKPQLRFCNPSQGLIPYLHVVFNSR